MIFIGSTAYLVINTKLDPDLICWFSSSVIAQYCQKAFMNVFVSGVGMPLLIDTHRHIHFPTSDANRDELMGHLREREMWAIAIGTGLKNSVAGIAFAEAHEEIFATVGLHLDHVTSDDHDHNEGEKPEDTITTERLIEIARSSKKCVAIGECGLDWYRLSADVNELAVQKAKQEVIFHEHLKAARELDLPLVIDRREALPRLAEILKACQADGWTPRGVVHSFTGTWVQAQPLLELGFHLGINGHRHLSSEKRSRS